MQLRIFLVLPPGAEKWASRELIERGVLESDIHTYPGGLEFATTSEKLPYWHSQLKIPVRLLVRLYEAETTTWEQLFGALESIPWDQFFASATLPKVHVASRSSKLFHKQQITERTEKWFQKRASKGKRQGDVYLRLFRDVLTISLDATGEALFKRGAKQDVGKAPLRENLAALMLRIVTQGMPPELISRYELVDPMAGSGTILMEAMGGALKKRSYAYESWPIFKNTPASHSSSRWRFAHHLGVDRDQEQYERLVQNLNPFKEAGRAVTWVCQDSLKSAPNPAKGCLGRILITNPPFGQRLKSAAKPVESLRKILKAYQPWRACFIGPESWKVGDDTFAGYRRMETLYLSHGGLKVQIVALMRDEPISLSPITAEVAANQEIEQHQN